MHDTGVGEGIEAVHPLLYLVDEVDLPLVGGHPRSIADAIPGVLVRAGCVRPGGAERPWAVGGGLSGLPSPSPSTPMHFDVASWRYT